MEQIGVELETMQRRALDEAHVKAIAAIGEEREYAAGDMVAEVGDAMDRFVYVIDGEIEVVDPYSGERMIEIRSGSDAVHGRTGLPQCRKFHFADARCRTHAHLRSPS